MLAARRAFIVYLAFVSLSPGFAQDNEQEAPAPPQLRALERTGWWAYFEGYPSEVEPRIAETLDRLGLEIADLSPTSQTDAESLLEATRRNLQAYLELLAETEREADKQLPTPQDVYSVDEVLALASALRDAQAATASDQLGVEREERVLDVAARRRDKAFRDYVDTEAGDERWLAGLRLLQARAALAISERRLELLEARADRTQGTVDALAERIDLARQRLGGIVDESRLNTLNQAAEETAKRVEEVASELRAAEVAAVAINVETSLGRAQQRLQQQRLTSAEVEMAIAQLEAAKADAHLWWARLQGEEDVDLDALEAAQLRWETFARDYAELSLGWKADTEDELLAVQRVDRDGLDRDFRRVLDDRAQAAQRTLGRVTDLEAGIDELTLFADLVDNAAARYSGTFASWLSRFSRGAKSAFGQLTELADKQLFPIGDTPITLGGLFRILIILTPGFLDLPGACVMPWRRHEPIRPQRNQGFAVHRGALAPTTSSSFQPSSLRCRPFGLDFTNLALVAGALSVGIGFGLQSIVSNFVSGLIILFEQTLRVGDYIELDTGLTGTVKSINVRSTLINTNDNIDIVVPNSEFVTARLTNWTLGERILRVRIPFGVAYGTDKELVRKAALEAAEKVPYTLSHMPGRKPDVWLVEYGDNSLNFSASGLGESPGRSSSYANAGSVPLGSWKRAWRSTVSRFHSPSGIFTFAAGWPPVDENESEQRPKESEADDDTAE